MFRLLGDVRRRKTKRRRNRRSASPNFFADVTLVRPRGRFPRGDNAGEFADTATSLNYCADIGLRCPEMKTATGHITEAAPPKRHLVGLFCACLCFSPRAANSAEQITELGRLTCAPARFLRHPWRLPAAIGRFRRGENQGVSAQAAGSLNHIATTDLRAARVRKYNRANITGHGHETALGRSVSRSRAFYPAGRPSPPGG